MSKLDNNMFRRQEIPAPHRQFRNANALMGGIVNSPDFLDTVSRMCRKGTTVAEMVKKLKVSPNTVRKAMKKRGIMPCQRPSKG